MAAWMIATAATGFVAAGLGWALLRSQRAHRVASEEQRWLLERERANAARSAATAERARIARELHDVVSHTVSLMVVQTTAAREVLDTAPHDAATAMRAVEEAGRSALTELRQLLGVLAPDSDDAEAEADFGPQPGLDRLSSLVDRFAFAGLPAEVRISGEPRDLPGGIDVTAYRIVQEALTNAFKHGGRTRAQVTVRYAARALRVEVVNDGPSVLTGDPPAAPPPAEETKGGAGRGLAGLKERVRVYGGDLDARRRLGGGFRVRARIPLDRP